MNSLPLVAPELASGRAAGGLLGLAERGWLPDPIIRAGIRSWCSRRLREEGTGGPAEQEQRFQQRIQQLREAPIAIHTEAANAQHYELPVEFFRHCLGSRLKYSCAHFPLGRESLDEAEQSMLALCGERAQLADGQEILELGCGWGSLTLWMAERFPHARISALSNSRPQREYIEDQCRLRGLTNVTVNTQDVNCLQLPHQKFDRCVSVEMFEHMRNYERLLQCIAAGLRPKGKLFVHMFVHRTWLYPFETRGSDNWLGRHFFTGGLMPSSDTLLWFQRDLQIQRRWYVPGTHYQRTAQLWLRNQDAHREDVMRVLAEAYGTESAALWLQRWRMFWMACAELFGCAGGQEWFVAHYLFARDE